MTLWSSAADTTLLNFQIHPHGAFSITFLSCCIHPYRQDSSPARTPHTVLVSIRVCRHPMNSLRVFPSTFSVWIYTGFSYPIKSHLKLWVTLEKYAGLNASWDIIMWPLCRIDDEKMARTLNTENVVCRLRFYPQQTGRDDRFLFCRVRRWKIACPAHGSLFY